MMSQTGLQLVVLIVQSVCLLFYSEMILQFTRNSFSVVVDLDSAGLDGDGDLAFSFYIRVAVAGQMYILDKNTALSAMQVRVIPKPHHQVTFSCGQTVRVV